MSTVSGLVLAAAVTFGSLPAAASVDPESQQDTAAFVADPVKIDVPRMAMNNSALRTSRAFWVWPSGRRAYFLTENNTPRGFGAIQSVDLDTGVHLTQAPLEPRGYSIPQHWQSTGRMDSLENAVAVDDEGGRLFVAYQTVPPSADLANGPRDLPAYAGSAAEGTFCANVIDRLSTCFAGIHVLDASTLEPLGRVSLSPVRIDGGPISAELLSMAYTSPTETSGGKVLMVVADRANSVSTSTGGAQSNNPRLLTATVTYLIQADPDTGRQDWAVRLDACRGTRETRNDMTTPIVGSQSHPAAVFKAQKADDPSIYVACHSSASSFQSAVVRVPLDANGAPASLPVSVAVPEGATGSAADGEPPAAPAAQSNGQLNVFGPDQVHQMIADPVSGRFLMKVIDGFPKAEVWWVFDTAAFQFIATIGIGAPVTEVDGLVGVDIVRGRMYVLVGKGESELGTLPHGLYVVDLRRSPVPQALHFPEVADLLPIPQDGRASRGLIIEPGTGSRPTRIWAPNERFAATKWRAIVDRLPLTVDPERVGYEGRTQDLEEAEGITASTLDGVARGYGFRALLVGGADAVARAGPLDPVGLVSECNADAWEPGRSSDGHSSLGILGSLATGGAYYTDGGPCADVLQTPVPTSCLTGNRDISFGFVGPDGPAVVDGSGARGSARPMVVDSATGADSEAPGSRCSGVDWQSLWGTALFGRPAAAEPAVPASDVTELLAQCVSSSERPQSTVGDPVTSPFAAGVECAPQEATGYSYVRAVDLGFARVAETMSSFRIYRDPGRGVVSRVESVVRGVQLDGVITLDTIRGSAESWANGRRQPVADSERELGYDPNCDRERTAGTCFQRHLFGVRTPGYSCGPCGDEGRLADALTKALGANGGVRLRTPNPALARGSENGFIAAVTKPEGERFADVVLNNDLLQTMVPSLEIIRYAPPNRLLSRGGARGRQIYQFAGVEVSSSYGIACLLVYDEESNSCAAEVEVPGSITVSLSGPDREPLAGGAFEVRQDVDADGVLGLGDSLLPDGACVTAEDGVGTCTFDGLPPGSYLVSQTASPPGYSIVAEPWVSELAPGEARTVTFTNTSNLSTIEMTATDGDGNPVEGATFAVYPDPDADGKVAPEAQPVATCTTDATGVCAMNVPAGSYVLVQTVAPAGLEAIEPVAFAFASVGQTAAVGVVNQAAAGAGQPAPPLAASPIAYTPAVRSAPSESVAGYTQPQTVAEPQVSVPERVGGTVVRVVRAPGDALRLLARDPKQAVAWVAALTLFGLALLAVRRRQLLGTLTEAPALAFTGGGTSPPGGGEGDGGRDRGRPGRRGGPPTRLTPGVVAFDSGRGAPASRGAPVGTAVLERPTVAGAAPAPAETMTVRVVVATAYPPLAAIVAQRLVKAERCEVLAVVDSLPELRQIVAEAAPDVLVLDLGLPTDAPEDICVLLPGVHPPERTMGLIPPHGDADALAIRGRRAGIAGMLVAEEDLGNGHLAYAVRQVAVGKLCYGPTVQTILAGAPSEAPVRSRRRRALTPRELQVARLAAVGVRRADIAERLFISHETVKRHLRSIREKLSVTDPWDTRQLRQRLLDIGALEDTSAPDISWGDPDDLPPAIENPTGR